MVCANPLCHLFLNIMSVYAPQTKSINFVKGTAFGSAIGSMKNTDWKRHIISLVHIQKSKTKIRDNILEVRLEKTVVYDRIITEGFSGDRSLQKVYLYHGKRRGSIIVAQ